MIKTIFWVNLFVGAVNLLWGVISPSVPNAVMGGVNIVGAVLFYKHFEDEFTN